MAKMNCEQIQTEILSCDGNLDPALQKHISQCKECRELAQQWIALKDVQPEMRRKVPKTVEFMIVNEADTYIRARAAHTKAFYRWLSFASAAACVALFALAFFATLRDKAIQIQANNENRAANASHQIVKWDMVSMQKEITDLRTEVEICIADVNIGGNDNSENNSNDEEFIIEIPVFLT